MNCRRHPSGFGLLLLLATCWPAAAAAADDAASEIALRSGVLNVRRPAQVAEALTAGPEAGGEYLLVKYSAPVTAAQYEALVRSVERVYVYLPHYTYLVKAQAGSAANGLSAASFPGALWAGTYHPQFKLSPALAAVAAPAEGARTGAQDAAEGDRRRPVMLLVYPDAKIEEVAKRVRALDAGEVTGVAPSKLFSRVRLLMTPEQIASHAAALARLPEVFWVEAEAYRALLNDTTIWVGQSGISGGQATPVFDEGIFGEREVVGVLDTGIDPDMCYFRDPARGLPPINACNGGTVVDNNQRKVIAVDFLWSTECAGGISGTEWDSQNHGTHVAGTVAGDNFANPLLHNPGDGMAPGSKLVIQDCGFQTDNCADCPGIGCPVVDLNPVFQQAYTQGARIHTNSWGDRENFMPHNTYSAGSQDADEFMWNHKDFLLFFAAGNDGPGNATVGSPSTGKNVVAVGATLRGTSAGSLASFSSCGPTADGRIKPDVTIPGSGILSAANDRNITSNNCNTRSSSGTSMASPGAAGLAALARQYFRDGFYPSGRRVPTDAFTPSAALLKAAMISSGRAMENVAAPPPSNCQGWGRVLLEDALFFEGQQRKLWVRDDTTGFPQGSVNQTREFRFTVAAGQPLKATLVWTDFPSTPAAAVNLNNDLDLLVVGPGGTFRGNVFSGGQSTTGGSADRRNTVEQVLLASPPAGEYVVRVQSANVPNGPQPFAVVLTGNVTPCDTDCGGGGGNVVFADDFEADRGWTRNAGGTDTAVSGLWERGDPEQTTSGATVLQLGAANSGSNDLVTARLAGASAGANDVDGGVTSIQSPAINLPSGVSLTLSFAYYLGHLNNAGADDFLRVRVVGGTTTTVLDVRGAAVNRSAAWATHTANISAFAGQTVRILIDAADAGTGSLVEAGVDDVRIESSGTPTPDFTVACSPSSLTVNQGGSTTSVCTVRSTGGFNSAVALSCVGLSAGTSCGFNPATVTPPANGSANSSLTVNASASAATGSFSFQVRGTSGSTQRNATMSLQVNGGTGSPVFVDDFEADRGWTRNPGGTDTAVSGLWERGDPEATTSGGVALQLGNANSGANDLVTARLAGASAGANDVDGGVTSIQSPPIALPSTGTLTLSFAYYFAHLNNATSADFLRVRVVGATTATVLNVVGSAANRAASWTTQTADISGFAGQTVRILIDTADAGTGSLIEAGIDDVRIQ